MKNTKIDKEFIVFLAKRHHLTLDNVQIKEIIFELNYLQKHFIKQWNDLDLRSFAPLNLPFFLKNSYLRPDNLIFNQPKNDFFLNLNYFNEQNCVFIAKGLKTK